MSLLSPRNKAEVVVLGAGVAGAAAAYYLAGEGADVTVVHRDEIGFGASGKALGLLNPLSGDWRLGYLQSLAMQSFRLHEELWPALADEAETDIELQRVPDLHLCLSEDRVDSTKADIDRWNEAEGFSARWLDGDEVRRLEPRVVESVVGAMLDDDMTLVNTAHYTRALADAAQRRGARFDRADVIQVAIEGGRVTGVASSDRTWSCDAVVVALGAWSGLVDIGFTVPIEPLKGQILHLELPEPALKYHIGGACQVVQKTDGRVWITSTVEQAGFEVEETQEARDELMERLARTVPEFTELSVVGQSACLRPIAPDGAPIVGPVPGIDGLYLTTGAGTKGVLLSAAMGRATADLVVSGETLVGIDGCSPDRFATAGTATG